MDYEQILFSKSINDLYMKRYIRFILTCKSENVKLIPTIYTENHHLLPKKIWTEYINFNQNPWNKVVLTARQHYLAHWMLAKSLGGGMWDAFQFMAYKEYPDSTVKYRVPSWVFEMITINRIKNLKWNTPEADKKRAEVVLEKYGVENVFQSEVIKEKIKETNLIKYGFENPSQSEEVKQKKILTTIDNYGVLHHNQLPENRQRISETTKITRSKDPLINCEFCSTEVKGQMNYNKWHGVNCTSNPNRKVQSYACQHCNTITENKGMYKRWHGDNCKSAIQMPL